jgi:hypothetical protein
MERPFVFACNTQEHQHIEQVPIDQHGTYLNQISDLIHTDKNKADSVLAWPGMFENIESFGPVIHEKYLESELLQYSLTFNGRRLSDVGEYTGNSFSGFPDEDINGIIVESDTQ